MNTELDKKLLSLLISDSALFADSLKDISADYFHPPYSNIYKILVKYFSRHKKIPSIDTIEEKLLKEKDKIFKNIENSEELILELRSTTAFVEKQDLEFLIEEIKNRKGYSSLEVNLPKAVELAKLGEVEKAAELLVTTGAQIKSTLTTQKIDHTSNHDHIDNLFNKYKETKEHPSKVWGIKTGFSKLDQATFGILPGELFIIAARPGCGKSMWLLSAAVNMFKQGYNIAYISIEMPRDQMWERTIANYCNLPISKIKEGTLSSEEEEMYFFELQKFKSAQNRFEIIDAPNVTVPTISIEIDNIIKEYQPDVLFVDYLGIIKPTEVKAQDNLAQAAVVEELRGLARLKKIPICTAVQLNRDPNKNSKSKTKGTERLARSDVISATADLIMQIEELDMDDELSKVSDKINIHIIKNRKGPFPLVFQVRKNFACAQFLDWESISWNELSKI